MRRDVDFARLRALPGRRVVNAAAGDRVVRQGDAASDLYVVVSGSVRLERDRARLADVGPSELFGEVALYGGGAQPYDAVATVASTLLAIPAESAQAAIAQAGKFALGLAQTLADRAAQLAAGGEPAAAAAAPPAAGGAPTGGSAPPAPGVRPAADLAAIAASAGTSLESQIAGGGAPPAAVRAGRPPAASAGTPPAADADSLIGGLPPPPWEVARQAAVESVQVDRSIPRPESFRPKSMKCPICTKAFQTLQPRDGAIEIASRDSDLYEHHRGINAMHYGIPVCPTCYYAAYPDDFNHVLSTEVSAIKAVLDGVRPRMSGVDFTGYRQQSHARTAFELGILCYGARRPQYRKVAGLYHRLAWLARAAGNAEREKAYLTTARAGYQSALEKNQVDDARTELLLTYLIADLSRRVGDLAEASRWASLALQHPQIGQHKMISDLAQQLRVELRSARPG